MPADFDPFDTTIAREDGVNTLAADAQELYHLLEREGAAWQARATPTLDAVNQRLQARITQLSAEFSGQTAQQQARASFTPIALATPLADSQTSLASRATRTARFSRIRAWGLTLATVAVVVAFLAVFALSASHRPGDVSSGQGAAGSATPAATAQTSSSTTTTAPIATGWTSLNQLDSSAIFSANDPMAIAPSDPQVVYQTFAQGLQAHQPASMRATSDGGKTWHMLPLPVPADHIGDMGVGVSPLNPGTVFLSLFDTTVADCPANRSQPLTEGAPGATFCRLQYTSVDGGAHWSATNLPLANGSTPGVLTTSVNSGMAGAIQSDTVRAQGKRLFAGYLCVNWSCERLVTSVDGGLSWSFADLPLLANGASTICDYTASGSGATLFAVTSAGTCAVNQPAPLTLWTSHDAGANWTKVSQLATPNERGMALTQNPATGATLLYIGLPRTTGQATDKMGGGYPIVSQSPSDVRVSVDSGKTWQSAPTQGIPSSHVVFFNVGLLGALSDGSVVVDVIPMGATNGLAADNFSGSALYAWKPGDPAWRLLGSVPREMDSLLITPTANGGDTLYALLTDRSGNPGGPTFAVSRETVGQ